MAEINEVVNVVDSLIKFIDLMNDLGICYSDILEISELCPDISDKIDIIENWRKGNVIIPSAPQNNEEDNNTSTVTAPETEIITADTTANTDITKRRNKYIYLKSETLAEVCRLIADEYDGKKLLETEAAISSIYCNYNRRTFHRIIHKQTYAATSNKYFTIKNGKIHKIRSK